MQQSAKRRHEVRYFLAEELPVTVLLRSVREGITRGVAGLLLDASKGGMGVLVQEHVALESRCVIEICKGASVQKFHGEVCYVTRTPAGLKLGIIFTNKNTKPILDYLAQVKVSTKAEP